MPIDASIPLQVKPPQINSPMQTMGDVLSLRTAQQRLQNEDQQSQIGAINLDAAQRKQHDDITYKGILEKYYKPDTGDFDEAGAVSEMNKHGLADHALDFKQKADAGRVAHIKAVQQVADAHAEALDTLWTNVKSIDTSSPDAATQWSAAYQNMRKATVDAGLLPAAEFDQYVPATFDASKVDALKKNVPSLQSYIKRTQAQVYDAQLAHDHRTDAIAFRKDTESLILNGIGGIAAIADKDGVDAQALWDHTRQSVTQLAGADQKAVADQLLSEWPTTWDASLVDRAAKMELGPAGLKAASAAANRTSAQAETYRQGEITRVQRTLQAKPSALEQMGDEPPPISVAELQDKIAAIDTDYRAAGAGPNGEDVKPALANRAKELLAPEVKALQARWDAYAKKAGDAAAAEAAKNAPGWWARHAPSILGGVDAPDKPASAAPPPAGVSPAVPGAPNFYGSLGARTSPAQVPPNMRPGTTAPTPKHNVGDEVALKGVGQVRITKIYDDGTFDYDPIKKK